MNFLQYKTGLDDKDRRLDRVVRKFLSPTIPLTYIYKQIRTGFIRVNNKKQKQDYRIIENDIIYIADFIIETKQTQEPNELNLIMSNSKETNLIELESLFKNEFIEIINKPYNINVQQSSKDEISLDKIIQAKFLNTSESLSFKPGPLHRLDKQITGTLAFSCNLQGAQIFTSMMKNHEIKKTYVAIVCGHVNNTYIWQDSIEKNETSSNNFFTVTVNSDNNLINTKSKIAKTIITPLAKGYYNKNPISYIEVEIETGRTHQIRSQCSYHGYPLLGDIAYNGVKSNEKQQLFLHAIKLNFPKNNKLNCPENIIAPLPKIFSSFIEKYLRETNLTTYNM